ncbi:hypothetical protein [Kitasatospora purpeofusca]|uniref:hypothetical protein n=1 Tax=Kitasatospora purpeofusca TaxID=67352 RepID=UPI0036462338
MSSTGAAFDKESLGRTSVQPPGRRHSSPPWRRGRPPAGGRTVLAGFDSGARPYLVRQSESTADICVA